MFDKLKRIDELASSKLSMTSIKFEYEALADHLIIDRNLKETLIKSALKQKGF